MEKHFDFGDIGVKIGDEIFFKLQPEVSFIIGSGNGTVGNRGTLVRYKDGRPGNYGLGLITKKLLEDHYSDELDNFSLWTYRGKTLRSIAEERKKGEVNA